MDTRGRVRNDPSPDGGKRGWRTEGEEEEEVPRGRTRSGAIFTRQSRGHYDSLAALKKVHYKLFLLEPTFYMVGEYKNAR
jgi:hypothetical protein